MFLTKFCKDLNVLEEVKGDLTRALPDGHKQTNTESKYMFTQTNEQTSVCTISGNVRSHGACGRS